MNTYPVVDGRNAARVTAECISEKPSDGKERLSISPTLKSPLLNLLFRDALYQPHFGHWIHIIRDVLIYSRRFATSWRLIAYRKQMRNVSAENAPIYAERVMDYALRAVEMKKAELPPLHPALARSYDNLEKIHEYRREWKEAIRYGELLIDLYQRRPPVVALAGIPM